MNQLGECRKKRELRVGCEGREIEREAVRERKEDQAEKEERQNLLNGRVLFLAQEKLDPGPIYETLRILKLRLFGPVQ